jgi:hypothetical protein
MSFPLYGYSFNFNFSEIVSQKPNFHRPKQVVIEEILKDSIKIERDLTDIQQLCDKLKTAKTQDEMMRYVVQMEKDLTDVINDSRQIYNDVKELVNYT